VRLQLIAMLLALSTSASADPDGAARITMDTLVYTDTDNVNILSPQVAVHADLDDEGGEASARVVVDIISAASVDVVSHATPRFFEVRKEGVLSLSKTMGPWLPSMSYRGSYEADYISHGGHVGVQRRLGSPDTTMALGYGITYDSVRMSGTPAKVFSEPLISHAVDATLTQTLTPKTLVRFVYSVSLQSGYMEKPYRLVPLFDQAGLDAAKTAGVKLDLDTFDRFRLDARPPEEVPDRRVRNAVALRALHYIDAIQGSARLDYQFYFDSWGVLAHTIEPVLLTRLSDRLRLALSGRFYDQSAASFWRRTYVVDDPAKFPKWRTLDRKLSAFKTVSSSIRAEFDFNTISTYAEFTGMYSLFDDYLFLDSRLALIAQIGWRWPL